MWCNLLMPLHEKMGRNNTKKRQIEGSYLALSPVQTTKSTSGARCLSIQSKVALTSEKGESQIESGVP